MHLSEHRQTPHRDEQLLVARSGPRTSSTSCQVYACMLVWLSPNLPSSMYHVLQVYLDPKERNTTEYKLDCFGGVYKRLTGREVNFEFPPAEAS